MIDIIGWIGNVFFIGGAILLAKKRSIGFVCNGIGNLFYVGFALLLHTPSLAVLSLFLIGVNIYGLYNWRIK